MISIHTSTNAHILRMTMQIKMYFLNCLLLKEARKILRSPDCISRLKPTFVTKFSAVKLAKDTTLTLTACLKSPANKPGF